MADATLIHLKDGTPAAGTGKQNVTWQQGSPYATTVIIDGVSVPVNATDVSAEIPDVGSGTVIGFIMTDCLVANNAGPMLCAAHSGLITKCKVVTKASDPSVDLQFRIKQNGVDVFSSDPTITHGTASGTVDTFTTLTSSPLAIAADDVFQIDILSGNSSWKVTIQLE